MKIYIIRHGDPDYAADSLTEKGWREAEFLSERLIKLPIDDFYCSPMGRARDTASLTLDKLGRKAEILDWLREFDGKVMSPFSGKNRIPWDLPPYFWCNDSRYYDLNAWSTTELMAGGNVSEVYKETVEGIDKLLERYNLKREGMLYRGGEDKSIALFCHFGMGITILSYLVGISPVVAQHNFCLAPTSVTTLVTETDKMGCSHFRVWAAGDTSHLYANNEPVSESALFPRFEK